MANDFKNAFKTNIAIDSGTYTTLYTAPVSKSSILLELDISNTSASAITTSVTVTDTSATVTSYLVKGLAIPVGNTARVIAGQKIVLEATDIIKVAASAASAADCVATVLEDV